MTTKRAAEGRLAALARSGELFFDDD